MSENRPRSSLTFVADLRVFGVVCLAGFILVVVTAITQGTANALIEETGGVQVFGLFVFFYGGVLAGWLALTGRSSMYVISCGFFLLALRELDIHDWWFEPGVLHSKFYVSAAPVWQKVVGLCLIGFILWVALRLVFTGLRPLLIAIRNRRGWALTLGFGLTLGALSTLLDGLDRKLAALGIAPPQMDDQILYAIEEIAELGLALCMVLSLTLFFRAVRTTPR